MQPCAALGASVYIKDLSFSAAPDLGHFPSGEGRPGTQVRSAGPSRAVPGALSGARGPAEPERGSLRAPTHPLLTPLQLRLVSALLSTVQVVLGSSTGPGGASVSGEEGSPALEPGTGASAVVQPILFRFSEANTEFLYKEERPPWRSGHPRRP